MRTSLRSACVAWLNWPWRRKLEPSLDWFVQTRVYPRLDKDLLGMLARSGFSTIEFGLESADQRTLKIVKKGISLQAVRRILSDCEEVGIKVILNFMIGFPWETEESGRLSA